MGGLLNGVWDDAVGNVEASGSCSLFKAGMLRIPIRAYICAYISDKLENNIRRVLYSSLLYRAFFCPFDSRFRILSFCYIRAF